MRIASLEPAALAARPELTGLRRNRGRSVEPGDAAAAYRRRKTVTHGPCGSATADAPLPVDEAAVDAAKHVFRPGRGSRLAVPLRGRGGGRVVVAVRDDGPGLGSPAPAAGMRGGSGWR
jgi:hypothetical protein